jgi:hypothetical protein
MPNGCGNAAQRGNGEREKVRGTQGSRTEFDITKGGFAMAQAAETGFWSESVEFDAAPVGAQRVSWQRAHEELVRLAEKRAGLDFEEGRWLLRAFRSAVHVRLGYGSFNEYTERLFGYGSRLTQEKLRVAQALEELPETARELQNGHASFSAVRELTRVATPTTEREWLAAAQGRTVREVEQLVSGHRPGSRPDDGPDLSAKRHVLRLDLSGEALATFREAMAKVRRDAGEALDEDAAVLLLCRQVLEGPRDEGRASYQVALTVCERCRHGMQQGRGELVPVTPEIVDMAECDGQHIGHVELGADDAESCAHVGAPDDPQPAQSGERAHVGVNRTARRSGDGSHAHVGDGSHAHVGGGSRAHVGAKAQRATQSVPPARRRAVQQRDGGHCRVPGCRHATFVDVHHLRLRSEGGTDELDNLLTLCAAHHRALHRGRLRIEGTPSQGLTFRHADGTLYGAPPAARSVDLRARAHRALTQLGYRESETKQALARLPATADLPLKDLILLALRELS